MKPLVKAWPLVRLGSLGACLTASAALTAPWPIATATGCFVLFAAFEIVAERLDSEIANLQRQIAAHEEGDR